MDRIVYKVGVLERVARPPLVFSEYADTLSGVTGKPFKPQGRNFSIGRVLDLGGEFIFEVRIPLPNGILRNFESFWDS